MIGSSTCRPYWPCPSVKSQTYAAMLAAQPNLRPTDRGGCLMPYATLPDGIRLYYEFSGP